MTKFSGASLMRNRDERRLSMFHCTRHSLALLQLAPIMHIMSVRAGGALPVLTERERGASP